MTTTPARIAPAPAGGLAGAGPLRRSIAVLRYLATTGSRGGALTDIARALGLPHPTVHRLLRQLVEERMVRQLESNRCYALGALSFELGVAAAQQFDMRGICRPVLERLALRAGDTAYLIVRSSQEAVCMDLQEGPSPIRVVTLRIGSRRPLGVGAGGLAILAALPTPERQEMLRLVQDQVQEKWGVPHTLLRASIDDARRRGYAVIRNRVSAGVSAVGQHFCDPLGNPIAALSVAATSDRLTPLKIRSVAPILAAAVEEVRVEMRKLGSAMTAWGASG